MDKSRHTSPIVLIALFVAASVALIQQEGFFDGVFRSDIFASVKTEEALSLADSESRTEGAAVDHRATAAIR
ncbi:hypothetical protein [Rhizobium sp. YTU87027]|uniref:hypothetical protein n=1 Tax=Rhizobium sp. YTU87027 TaxID=3417741 RepID=UPI003D68483A